MKWATETSMRSSPSELIFLRPFFFFLENIRNIEWFWLCGSWRIEKKLYCVDNRSGNKWLSKGSDCVWIFLCACVLMTGDKTARITISALFTVKCVLHRGTCRDSEGSEFWPGGADEGIVINQRIHSNRRLKKY